MSYEAVAWDIDGTLVDSEPLHLEALLAVSSELGADLSDLAPDHFVGVNMHDVWAALKTRYPAELTQRDWIARINAYYAAHASELIPMPRAVDTVRALAERGVLQVAVSNSGRAVVDANLNALGLTGLFAFSLSLDDVPRGKPDPRPYLMAVGRLGLLPDEVLAVEDSATGAQSAWRAGLGVAYIGPRAPDFQVKKLACLNDVVGLVAKEGAHIGV
ncbi:MAG: HAD family phosphatase [Rhodobacteraceae bacterium]|nr:HAD family phosphatase [Paracoccaceae bacterium]